MYQLKRLVVLFLPFRNTLNIMRKLTQVEPSLNIIVKKLNKTNQEPNYIKFDDFFRSEKMLNFLGMTNLPRDKPLNRIRERRALFQLSMIITIVFFGLNVTSFMYGLLHGGSLLVLIENVSIISIESTILIKVLTIMYWQRETFVDIMLKLKLNFPVSAWDQHIFHVHQHLKTLNVFGTICASLYRIVLVQFASMPILIKLYGLMFSQETKWELIFQTALPLDTSVPFVYIIKSIIDIWSVFGSGLIVLIPDLLFNELVAVVNLELAILAKLMSEIDPSDGQDEAIDKLKKLSEKHQELIAISDDLRNILSALVFIDCFGMMISVCCHIFLSLVIYFRFL